MSLLDRLLQERLAWQEALSLRRVRRPVRVVDSTHVRVGEQTFVNFCSNNYLGLTHHPRVLAACAEALKHGTGAGASGLICGYSELHEAAENALAQWKSTEACILMPSGYQAAHAVVQAIAGACRVGTAHLEYADGGRSNVRFLADKLCHASLIDAIHASGETLRIFPHNDVGKLQRLLEQAPPEQVQVVVTESIFSMDGDAADLQALVNLKRRLPFVLVLDEAHGSGVFGANGSGYAAECALGAEVDVSIVTLSKAMGLVGGAICASRTFCEAVINWGRSYIFSTSVPPMIAAGVIAALGVMRDEPWRQHRVRQLAQRVRENLRCATPLSPAQLASPIIPVILGQEERALRASQLLREQGLLVAAIRPPAVARGTSRLRITLSCDHTDDQVQQLVTAVNQICACG